MQIGGQNVSPTMALPPAGGARSGGRFRAVSGPCEPVTNPLYAPVLVNHYIGLPVIRPYQTAVGRTVLIPIPNPQSLIPNPYSSPVPTTINILMVSPDPRFRAELESALASLDELHPVIHHADDIRQAIEAARSRRPQIALVEMGTDVRPLQAFAEEAAVVSPETTVAAVFRPDGFEPDVSESTILIQAIRAGVKDFLRRPVSSSELAELLRRIQRSAAAGNGPLGPRSSPSSATRAAWENRPWPSMRPAAWPCVTRERVLLVDASLQMGVCASLLGSDAHDVAQRRGARDRTGWTRPSSGNWPCRTPAACTFWPRPPMPWRPPTSTTRCCPGFSPLPGTPMTSCWSIRFPCWTARSWRCWTSAIGPTSSWKTSCPRSLAR